MDMNILYQQLANGQQFAEAMWLILFPMIIAFGVLWEGFHSDEEEA